VDEHARSGPGRAVFLVEAYRRADVPAFVADATVVGVIDIPADETILYLVAVSEAKVAERIVRAHGIQPIRVVDVRWTGR